MARAAAADDGGRRSTPPSRTNQRREARKRARSSLENALKKNRGYAGADPEVEGRLALAAPLLVAGLGGRPVPHTVRRRRNAALHCFSRPAKWIATASQRDLNGLQRGGVADRDQSVGSAASRFRRLLIHQVLDRPVPSHAVECSALERHLALAARQADAARGPGPGELPRHYLREEEGRCERGRSETAAACDGGSPSQVGVVPSSDPSTAAREVNTSALRVPLRGPISVQAAAPHFIIIEVPVRGEGGAGGVEGEHVLSGSLGAPGNLASCGQAGLATDYVKSDDTLYPSFGSACERFELAVARAMDEEKLSLQGAGRQGRPRARPLDRPRRVARVRRAVLEREARLSHWKRTAEWRDDWDSDSESEELSCDEDSPRSRAFRSLFGRPRAVDPVAFTSYWSRHY